MFAVVISDHRLWGYRFQPCLLPDDEQADTLQCLRLGGADFPLEGLSDVEVKIVRLCEKYAEQFVMRIFVKEKLSVAEFQTKYLNNRNNYPQIQPFIEKTNYEVANLLRGTDIPVYIREKNFAGVYRSDRVEVLPLVCRPVPAFDLSEEELTYTMKVFSGSEEIPFRRRTKNFILLSSEPCCYVCGKRLCLFESMIYKRILPFMEKEGVDVPIRTVPSYMKSFVLPTLEKEDVEAHGFAVENRDYDPQPVLTLEEDLSLHASLRLSFNYGDISCDLSSAKRRFVSLSEEEGFKFTVIDRCPEVEKQAADALSALGLRQDNNYFYVMDKTDSGTWLHETVDFLIAHSSALSAFTIRQKLDKPEIVMASPKLDFDVKVNDVYDWFDIRALVHVGDESFPFACLRRNIIDGNREYVMRSGNIFIIPEPWFAQYKDLFLFMEANGEDANLLKLDKCHVGMLDTEGSASVRDFRGLLEQRVDLPSGLKTTLRDYQHVGYSWLVGLYENGLGGCLADDMGLGKTLQLLAFFLKVYEAEPDDSSQEKSQFDTFEWPYESAQPSLFDQPVIKRSEPVRTVKPHAKKKSASLVIMPASLLFNWVNEKGKFAPSLRHLLYAGSNRVSAASLANTFDRYHLVFTTYGLVRRNIEHLKNYHFECVVMDESQYVKNASSQAYKAIMELDAAHFYCMSGTPIENSLEDLWSQMNLANRGVLGSVESFRKIYVNPIVKRGDEERAERVKRFIKPFLLRRTKEEVAADLPPVVEQLVYCDMNEEHREIYEREKSMVRNSLMSVIAESGVNKNSILALSSLTRLRELSNHPKLLFDDCSVESEKMNEVVRRIQNLKEEGHKVLVFSSFVRLLELLQERLDAEEVKYTKLTGETQRREQVVSTFQNDPSVVCFLISLKAGGVGLNLMAADYVFILDPWWNPAAEMQAVDRSHRIGQNKTVFVYRFLSKDTVEEKIHNMQTEKLQLSDMFVNSNNPFADVDLETLEQLFG
ncbi:MAG: DEAD/DEAH box helicase [Paludibacteraceae bacterium]|nr:DEAD/DEAH box helicase [Paludibacteraceae bacterium]